MIAIFGNENVIVTTLKHTIDYTNKGRFICQAQNMQIRII